MFSKANLGGAKSVRSIVSTGLAAVCGAAGVIFWNSLTGMTVTKADAELAKTPMFVAIRHADPDAYDHIRRAVIDGANKHKPPAEIQAALRPYISDVTKKFLPLSSDDAIVSFTSIMTLEIDQIALKSSDRCIAFLYGKELDDISSFVTQEVLQKDNATTAAVIESGLSAPQTPPTREKVTASLGRVARALNDTFGAADVAALSKPASLAHDRLCALNAALYKNILSLPIAEAAQVLRFLFSQTGSV